VPGLGDLGQAPLQGERRELAGEIAKDRSP
jgi:hypothetical protein